MDDVTQPQQAAGANLLEAVSKERFRRRLLIASRILAFGLVLALFWWGYVYMQYGKVVAKDPCFACGYYRGKECKQVYFSPQDLQTYSQNELLTKLAEKNAAPEPYFKDEANPNSREYINMSSINLTPLKAWGE